MNETQLKSGRQTLVVLLALAIFIHALDRGNFATAAPVLKEDLGLTNTQIGLLLSAFFWTYVPGHVLAGWLIERINAYRTLALGVAVWSLATLLTGFAGGFATLLVLRLLLGIGESAGFPASSKLLASNLPGEKLASANGLIAAGLMFGNAGGVLLSGMVLAAFGWKALFIAFGVFSLVWLVPWLGLMGQRSAQATAAASTEPAPSYRQLLSRRETWGAMLGMFCANYPYFIVLSWLPLYLVKQQGYSLQAMAWIGGAVYLIAALANIVLGRLADRLIAGGVPAGKVRKGGAVIGGGIAVACMLLCAFGSPAVAVAALVAFAFSPGVSSFSIFSLGQSLAGPRAAGKWMGLQNGVGGMAGAVGPLLTGYLIDATGDYRMAFLFAAGIALVGMALWGLMVGKGESLEWD